jgi:hypothetical protein
MELCSRELKVRIFRGLPEQFRGGRGGDRSAEYIGVTEIRTRGLRFERREKKSKSWIWTSSV